MVDRSARRVLLKSNRRCGVCLGITINEQGRLLRSCQACCQVHCCGCLPDATLLIRNGYNAGQSSLPNSRKISNSANGCKMFHVERHSNCGFPVGILIVPRGTCRSNSLIIDYLRGQVLQNNWNFVQQFGLFHVKQREPICRSCVLFSPAERATSLSCSTWNHRVTQMNSNTRNSRQGSRDEKHAIGVAPLLFHVERPRAAISTKLPAQRGEFREEKELEEEKLAICHPADISRFFPTRMYR